MGKFTKKNNKSTKPSKKQSKQSKAMPKQGTQLDIGVTNASKDIKKATTFKGKKILEKRAPKVVENKKTAIFLKGNKSSITINDLLRDLHLMRGDAENSKVFTRKSHDVHPFDNAVPLESFASKQDCSIICFGNHQKKRPDNLVLGRTYDGRILDIFEFGVHDFKSCESFKGQEIARDMKPVLVFQGEQFEFSERHIRIKNLFYDFFYCKDLKEVNIVEMKRILVFTAIDDTLIQVRHYQAEKIAEHEIMQNKIDLKEIGPHFDLKLRRIQLASHDLYKTAIKKPKILNPEKKRKEKNIFLSDVGDKMGKVFIQQQDTQIIATRKFKKQRPVQKVEAADV